MRIGIFTQPLHNNYGGLLQNYALQTVLSDLGHEVLTINIDGNVYYQSFIKLASVLKRSLLKASGRDIVIRAWPTKNELKIISHNTNRFVNRNIKTTKLFTQKINENLLKEYAFDAYIVGSDQVWRPRYSPQLSTFFLDFLQSNSKVMKIAYAASFGVDDWEFTNKQTKEFAGLLKLFDAVSVREDSAVELCKNYFGVEATHLLDPTMLVDLDDYTSLVEKENIEQSQGNLFTYILDKDSDKLKIIDDIAQTYNLKSFSVLPLKKFSEPGRIDIHDYVFPAPEKWIRGFMDAQFVVTDSFHGTVFSILFNKPFISIANKGRGLTRFTSLLKLFHLEGRLIFSSEDFIPDNLKEVDWDKTNAILNQEKEKSIQFLKKSLN
jgi:polysaccharide pyruvyl transferase WcaK-like protein